MFQLLATPERFDGKLVSVIGFLTLGREDDNIYPYELDVIHLIGSNSLGVDRTERMTKEATSLNRKCVILVGTFKKADKDQLIAGTITNIRRCDIWSDPKIPIS